MGVGNANLCGGMDRPKVAKVTADLDTQISLAPEGPACDAMRAARDALRDLQRRLPFARDEAIEDPGLEATGYKTEFDVPQHEMRIAFYRGAERNVLAWMILKSPEVYDFGTHMIRKYDDLEGIS